MLNPSDVIDLISIGPDWHSAELVLHRDHARDALRSNKDRSLFLIAVHRSEDQGNAVMHDDIQISAGGRDISISDCLLDRLT